MSTSYNFQGRRVLVTGGAGGLGKATVQKFLEAGATVIAADRDEASLASLLAQFPTVTTIQVDLSNWDETTKALRSIGPIHHLVNNAGIAGAPRKFLDIQPQDVDTVFDINFKSIINVSQLIAKGMIKSGAVGATIVNVSSVMAKIPYKFVALYCASKAAVSMLTRSMASELEPHKIRVNAVCPTIMDTNLTRPPGVTSLTAAADDQGNPVQANKLKFMNFLVQRQITKRLLTVEETADLILYLSSSSSSMIVGEDIFIDGGILCS